MACWSNDACSTKITVAVAIKEGMLNIELLLFPPHHSLSLSLVSGLYAIYSTVSVPLRHAPLAQLTMQRVEICSRDVIAVWTDRGLVEAFTSRSTLPCSMLRGGVQGCAC